MANIRAQKSDRRGQAWQKAWGSEVLFSTNGRYWGTTPAHHVTQLSNAVRTLAEEQSRVESLLKKLLRETKLEQSQGN